MRAVRGQAVRADTEGTVETEDVFLVLFGIFMNHTGVEEFLAQKRLHPDGYRVLRTIKKQEQSNLEPILARNRETDTERENRINPPFLSFLFFF